MSFALSQRDVIKFALNYTKGKPVELTQAILAARKANGLIQETDFAEQRGKKRKLFINYYAPDCTDEGTGTENLCDAGEKQEPKQAYFEISQTTASKVKTLDPRDIRLTDSGWTFSQHAVAQIASLIPTLREKMNNQIAALMVANVGLLPNGNGSQLLPILNKENGVVNPMGLWEIERAYRDSGYSNPYIVGGTDVFHWKKAVGIGGMNNSGQNVAQMGHENLFYDAAVNTTFGDATTEHVISFDPEMVKFVSFNRNAGIFATDKISIEQIDSVYAQGSENLLRGVWTDPVTGLIWDLNAYYDPCGNSNNGEWNFQLKLEWDLFFMPAAVCNKQGVNGIYHWTTCVQLVQECETGSPITPASSATYAYDTSGNITYPYIAQKVEIDINGSTITAYPNTSLANITALKNMLNDIANGVTFTVSGTELQYTGYSAITVQLNDTLTMTFAV